MSTPAALEEAAIAAPLDPPPFEEWVAAHGDSLARFAELVIGNRVAAQDALQEALSRAYPRWSRIWRADDPLAYVRRMIVNAHTSWRRSVGRRETNVASPIDSATSDSAAAGHDPGEDELWRLCMLLPARQRAAVVLRFYEGLTYREVAAVLGVTEVTARTQTHRALTKLRTSLEAL